MEKNNKKEFILSDNSFGNILKNLEIHKEKISEFKKEISTKNTSEESYSDLAKKQNEIDWEKVKSRIKTWSCFGIFGLFAICVLVVYLISILQIFGKMETTIYDFSGIIFDTVLLGIGGFIGWILNEFLKK